MGGLDAMMHPGVPFAAAVGELADADARWKEKLRPMPTLDVVTGDITTQDVDAIVNAANSQLARGGGVCGAIHQAAGPELAEACARQAPCPTGEARITEGFELPARYVIHAVGPRWRGGGQGEATLLAAAYRSAFELAEERGLTSIALPAISTGIYGYPLEEAVRIAVDEARSAQSRAQSLERIVFVAFSDEVRAAFERALEG